MARLAHVPPIETAVPVTRAPHVLGPTPHAILRIGVGLLFLQHALQKLGFLGGHPVPLGSLLGVAAASSSSAAF
jgi:hypothetical protein